MSTKISLAYIKGLPEDDKKKMYDEYLYSRGVLLKLREILVGKSQASLKKQRAEVSYESPAWSEKQADGNGYQRAIEEIITNLLPTPVAEK